MLIKVTFTNSRALLLNINKNFKKHIKELVHKPHKTTKHNGELALHEICKGWIWTNLVKKAGTLL